MSSTRLPVTKALTSLHQKHKQTLAMYFDEFHAIQARNDLQKSPIDDELLLWFFYRGLKNADFAFDLKRNVNEFCELQDEIIELIDCDFCEEAEEEEVNESHR